MNTALDRLYDNLVSEGYGEFLTRGELLCRHTSFAIGGPSDIFVVASTPEQLAKVTTMGWTSGVPVFVLGGGTNVLVADAGVRGMTVANRCARFSVDGDGLLRAESGSFSIPFLISPIVIALTKSRSSSRLSTHSTTPGCGCLATSSEITQVSSRYLILTLHPPGPRSYLA